MYQSLYRKYRPSSFEEVMGQKVIVQTLKNSIKDSRISHAYLFTGPRGTGKTSIAKILAKTINCSNLKDLLPCNECSSCIQINNKQSIDIIEIDAASNNGVDEIREINNKVNLVPSVGKYKVYIIDEVHMLTTGAFNALLKTLEEPPAHIIFILATTEPHKIPATILSRCQRFDFKKLNKIEIVERIKQITKLENISINEEAVNEIANLSDGGMRDALSMLDQAIAYAEDEITIEDIHEINGTITKFEIASLVEKIVNNEINEIFKSIDAFDLKGKDFVKLTEEMISFFRDLLLNMVVPNYFENSNYDVEMYDNICKNLNKNKLLTYIEEFNNTIPSMKNSNNPKIIFELLIIKITDIKQNVSAEKVVEKVEKEVVVEQIIKEEPKIEIKEKPVVEVPKKIINNEEENKIIEEIKKIRINNALCNLNKNEALEIKNKISSLMPLMMNDKYSEIYSIILDGKLVAFGNNTLIFVFDSKRATLEFNLKLNEIDELVKSNINELYKTIAVDNENWNEIKKDYAKNSKNYTLIEEPSDLIEKINKKSEIEEKNNIEQMFENIVQYN